MVKVEQEVFTAQGRRYTVNAERDHEDLSFFKVLNVRYVQLVMRATVRADCYKRCLGGSADNRFGGAGDPSGCFLLQEVSE